MDIKFFVSKFGIGDAICGLYSACGMASGGHKVTLATRQKAWLKCASYDNVGVTDHDETGIGGYLNYRNELKESRLPSKTKKLQSRACWYTCEVADQLGIKLPMPKRPQITMPEEGELGSGYVLLAPYSTDLARNWPDSHWRRLVKMLVASGHRVVVIHSKCTDELVKTFSKSGATYHWGNSIDWVVRAVAHASITIGNDSGMVHVAGLLGRPAIALVSQMRPEFLFKEAPSISSIVPPMSCAGCHWQEEGGWNPTDCGNSCMALGTITPDTVFAKVTDRLKHERV